MAAREADRPGEVHVLFCANRDYYRHAAVAAVSLATATRAPVVVHVVTTDDCTDEAERLRRSLRPFAHLRLETHRVERARVAGAFVDRYITGEAYLRFLAPELLPERVERVVYLDCDLVVLGDIATLAAAPLEGKAVGAVPEWAWSGPDTERRLAALGIPSGHRYVNSGVLVMDLARWRRDGLADRIFAYVAACGSRLAYHDQDALNAVLQDDIALVDPRWNLQPLMLGRFSRGSDPEGHRRAVAARRDPGIIHYTTARKPWLHRVSVRDRRLYFRFLARTDWRGQTPPLAGAFERMEYGVARRLLAVGIDVYRVAAGIGAARAAVARRLFPGGARPEAREGQPTP